MLGDKGLPVSSTTLAVVSSIVGLALFAWPVSVWYEVRKLEKPAYEVLRTVGNKKRAPWDRHPSMEIRRYAPFLIAKVELDEPDMKRAGGAGFKKIASFIFGENVPAIQGKQAEKIAMTSPVVTQQKSEKIAMTSPVTTEMRDGKYVVAFVMPSKYTKDNIPKPKDDSVKIEEVPEHTYGAISWRGWPKPDDGAVARKRKELIAALHAAGIKVDESADSRLYQYYPPFAPQFLRLQDVLLPVEFDGSRPPNKKAD